MRLRKQDQEFRNPRIFYPDPKNVDLDRVLINLFVLLRCGGTRPVTRGRVKNAFERTVSHLRTLQDMPGVTGFREYEFIAKRWLETDIFDLVNRGRPNEAIASLRPLHLDAHKIRVVRHARDYNHSDALYALLHFGERQTLDDLKAYLEEGRAAATDRYDGSSPLDLETLTVLKLVEGLPNLHPSGDPVALHAPTCVGQARVLCDDIQRILAYRHVVPRAVMIDYVKSILALHLGLYTLRLGRQLTGWIADKRAHPTCRECPVHGRRNDPFAGCPYQVRLTTDMGGDFRSRMAGMAQEDASSAYAGLLDLVRSVFAMNQLLRYAKSERLPEEPMDVPSLLAEPPASFESDFKAELKMLRNANGVDNEELTAEEADILDAGLSSFETLVELVTHVRQRHHIKYLVQMLDKLFQKNDAFGALAQGRSRRNPRRWHLGGRLLETMVQLAVLRFDEDEATRAKKYYSEPVLVDDFLEWVENRYGFVVAPARSPAGRRPITLEEQRAFRDNIRALKDRLREIGFYDDLSDAFNAQTIRPRYQIERQSPGAVHA